MSKDNGGESPQVREVGDAPNITRLFKFEGEENYKTFRSSWSSPEKFAAHIGNIDGSQSWYGGGRSWAKTVWDKTNTEHQEFSGVKDLDEALGMCRDGWKEGGALIETTRGYIQALNPLSPKVVKYGIAGSSPNVPRAIAGHVLNMRVTEKRASMKRKTITILYNMCESGMTNKDNISNKAAVTAALIDEIEAKGFSVEVLAIATTNSGSMRACTSVCVKESHLPVDINRLAFSLGHAAMFRMLFFADWEGDDFCRDLGYGLGIVSTASASKELNDQQIYIIESGHQGNIPIKLFKTVESSAKEGLNKIIWALQKQGCPAFPPLKDHEDDLEKPSEEDDEEEEYYYT